MSRILKLVPLSVILLLVILSLQRVFFSSSSWSSNTPEMTQFTFGMGRPVKAITIRGETTYDIKWTALAGNLAASYTLALLLSAAFTTATRLRRPALAYSLVAVVVIAVAFIVAIGVSRVYWGYFLNRPPLPAAFNDIVHVSAVIPVETPSADTGQRTLVVQKDVSLADKIASGKNDPYYCLDERLLIGLEERRLLPAAPFKSLSNLPALFPLIKDSGLLATPEAGYEDSDRLQGIVVDAVDRSGSRLVFLGLTGLQVSNDHYPYYEMLFSGQKGSTALTYVRGQRFFYDVAGMEGAEWYSLWPPFSLIAMVIAFPVFTIVAAWKRNL